MIEKYPVLHPNQAVFFGSSRSEMSIESSYVGRLLTSTNKDLLNKMTDAKLVRIDDDEYRKYNGDRGIMFGLAYYGSNSVRLVCSVGTVPVGISYSREGGAQQEIVLQPYGGQNFADFLINTAKVNKVEIRYEGMPTFSVALLEGRILGRELLDYDRVDFDIRLGRIIEPLNSNKEWTYEADGGAILYMPKRQIPPTGYKIYISIWPSWWKDEALWRFTENLVELAKEGRGVHHIKLCNPDKTSANKKKFLDFSIVSVKNVRMLNKDLTIYTGSSPEETADIYETIMNRLSTCLSLLEKDRNVQPPPLLADFMPMMERSVSLRYGVYHGAYWPNGMFDDSYLPQNPFFDNPNPIAFLSMVRD